VKESWPIAKTARRLEADEVTARRLIEAYRDAAAVVDAGDPAESFRNSVRQAVRHSVANRMTADEIEKLVVQICYRAADLAYLLDQHGVDLSQYSEQLRAETNDAFDPIDPDEDQ
jgi:hypothetical protein